MKTIRLTVMTPEKTALSLEALSVQLTLTDGLYGVLPGHEPMLFKLSPGTLRIQTAKGTQLFPQTGGFARVEPDRISVFTLMPDQAPET